MLARSIRLLAAVLISLSLSDAASAAAIAQIYGSGSVYYSLYPNDVEFFEFSDFGEAPIPIPGAVVIPPSFTGFGTAFLPAGGPAGTSALVEGWAYATIGRLGVDISAAVNAPLLSNQQWGSANVSATFSDDLTILPDDPALLGTPGTLSGHLSLTGNLTAQVLDVPLTATPQGSSVGASWTATLIWSRPGEYYSIPWSATAWHGSLVDPTFVGSPLPATLPVELSFYFGSTYELSVSLGASIAGVAGFNNGNVSADANLFDTLSWGGISSVVDADGVEVPYEVQSTSGVNWAVPEPDFRSLLLTVLALPWLWQRRQRRASRSR